MHLLDLIAKLRYMGRQYANGQTARGGGQQKHYLEEAADEIERLRAALRPFAEHPTFHAPDEWPVTVIDRNGPTGEPVPGVTAGDFRRAARAMTPNVELTGSGQVHRPESSDRRERG